MQKKNVDCDRKTALVVDDDEICRCVTAEILGNLGIEVHLSPDAEHAVSLAQANTYDLLLLDLRMPSMNGVELAGLLLENGLATKERIFLLTAEDPDDAMNLMPTGLALRMLRKPLERARIESFFSGQSAPTPASNTAVHETARIEGFDIPLALANFMGYESAYFNILREFPDYGATFISEYSAYLQSKNFKECRRLAHSIKGSSLMIGATELSMLATKLETACLISPESERIQLAFDMIEEKIIEASENVKKHFHRIDSA
ncbi:MAG: response regulator [Desulfomicrobium sp.]|nr:response regulator [Pseudomonadota bacterium]MBV1710527.1 response regulator [Desulfomicrobium sp.]MBU4570135.1 response regulator [Pseudomonadota bacterium]MBU4593055.1 response regulator [Pseudomonadota bacterium]MBV1718864.1 response regulator [Desulfomicrobium sp.]